MFLHFLGYKTAHDMPCSINIGFVQFEFLMGDHADGAVPGSNPGGVGHRDFSHGYLQNHVPWGQLSL